MRKILVPVLSAVMLFGSSVVAIGCGDPPPPKSPEAPPPEPKAKPKPKRQKTMDFKMKDGALALPGPVVFETGKDILAPESDAVLEVVEDYLEAKPEVTKLRIEGHTDNDGLAAANLTLSQGRAMAVARWLVAKGVKCERLVPVGFGQMKPIAGTADKQTKEEKEQNRRVAFVNAEIKGKAIGGMPVDGGGTSAGDPCK